MNSLRCTTYHEQSLDQFESYVLLLCSVWDIIQYFMPIDSIAIIIIIIIHADKVSPSWNFNAENICAGISKAYNI